jgi:hypothetical protein
VGYGGKAMSSFYIHYRATDGEILAHELTTVPSALDGLERIQLDEATYPDPKLHKVDISTKTLVDKTEAERRSALLPTDHEVKSAIFYELRATDSEVVSDRPTASAAVEAWKTYRQTLRDLSKQATPTAMIQTWPTRPDGTDVASNLRARIS